MLSEINSKLSLFIEETAKRTGYLIYKKNVYNKGRKVILDIRIDNRELISHDDCRKFSMELTNLIDNYNSEIDYQLEVSSPGINRELRSIEEFERFIDSNIKIKYKDDNQVLVAKGLLINVEGNMIIVQDGAKKLQICLEQIIKANLEQIQ